MNAWGKVLSIGAVVAAAGVVVALNVLIELSAIAMFAVTLVLGFGAYVVWDNVLMKDVDTYEEIVEKENIAYAIYMLIPALLILAASLVK